MTEHNWSGWPGAFCLNCGAEDVVETECLNMDRHPFPDGLTCVEGHCMCDQGHEVPPCVIHKQGPCRVSPHAKDPR